METIMQLNSAINGFVWGPVMIFLLLGTGLMLTVRNRFMQFVKFPFAMNRTFMSLFRKSKVHFRDENNISPFQAVSTALASTVGTGNIVGVATAITLGGPGAIFWMWISAFLGMMTKYAEIVLAVRFRDRNVRGEYVGGPMYYLSNGLKLPWLGAVFAFFASFASFGAGNMTQANAISGSLKTTLGVSPTVTGLILAIIVAVVIIGGIQSIARVTELVVPIMATFYIVFAIILLILHAHYLPGALKMIFTAAFDPKSALGGATGYTVMFAIRMGMARGIFSNEAGLGTAPIAHAASSTKEPVEQGLWGIFEVFIDTIVVCTMTALIILTAVDDKGQYFWSSGEYEGAALTIKAFEQGLPGTIGGYGLTIGLSLFAISTIFGWCYYGEKSIEYLFRKTRIASKAAFAYRCVYVVIVFIGAVGGLHVVWDISDTLNGLMAIPNLIGVLFLSGIVIKETRSYFARVQKGEIK